MTVACDPRAATSDDRRARLAEARSWAGVRSAHFSRETGTMIVVYDQFVGWAEDDGIEERWATLCDDHGQIVSHPTLALAKSHAANPLGWCEVCNGNEPSDPLSAPGGSR